MSISADMEKRAFASFCGKLEEALRKEHGHQPGSKCCLKDRRLLAVIWKVASSIPWKIWKGVLFSVEVTSEGCHHFLPIKDGS